jgi:GNAT superfamily N-acetyltransferase
MYTKGIAMCVKAWALTTVTTAPVKYTTSAVAATMPSAGHHKPRRTPIPPPIFAAASQGHHFRGTPYRSRFSAKKGSRWISAHPEKLVIKVVRMMAMSITISSFLSNSRPSVDGIRRTGWYTRSMQEVQKFSQGRRQFDFVDLNAEHPWLGQATSVLAELRPGLTPPKVAKLLADAKDESLTFTACGRSGAVLGVAGWRVMTTSYVGRKLHVDDLVVTSDCRSAGAGRAMVEHLCSRGRELRCAVIDLDSLVHRFDAHRFYLREGFDITSHHFVRALT